MANWFGEYNVGAAMIDKIVAGVDWAVSGVTGFFSDMAKAATSAAEQQDVQYISIHEPTLHLEGSVGYRKEIEIANREPEKSLGEIQKEMSANPELAASARGAVVAMNNSPQQAEAASHRDNVIPMAATPSEQRTGSASLTA